jgi:DNA-binding XRE family transcriptional regulator
LRYRSSDRLWHRTLTRTLPNLTFDAGNLRIPFSMLAERTFPERVRAARMRAGLTQKQLALRAGLSKDLVYHWEREFHGATPRTLQAAARVLGVSAEYLRRGHATGEAAA